MERVGWEVREVWRVGISFIQSLNSDVLNKDSALTLNACIYIFNLGVAER